MKMKVREGFGLEADPAFDQPGIRGEQVGEIKILFLNQKVCGNDWVSSGVLSLVSADSLKLLLVHERAFVGSRRAEPDECLADTGRGGIPP